jgi:single-strand DNA-binding protein
MNILTGTGTCGRAAEVKYLPSGSAVLNVSVAMKSGFGDREQTIWLNVAVFGKKAEGRLKEFLTKGQAVAFSGELSIREYEKDGVKRVSHELNANILDLIGKKSDSQPSATPPQSHHNEQKSNAYQPQPDNFDDFDSDIPF